MILLFVFDVVFVETEAEYSIEPESSETPLSAESEFEAIEFELVFAFKFEGTSPCSIGASAFGKPEVGTVCTVVPVVPVLFVPAVTKVVGNQLAVVVNGVESEAEVEEDILEAIEDELDSKATEDEVNSVPIEDELESEATEEEVNSIPIEDEDEDSAIDEVNEPTDDK
ncbi:hypothetical protein WICMUC_001966 [Wickerhamomyces mucosus]|uniref:Uncharacterized protein n=1 Tax=Wickerhamomyces mucosus TaxID=1378264 RepID=A0A9P8TFU7_9ASCO|nr:hypothetical protein WICMUC_001966 [Wickerhamomyces mucosus]